MIDKDQNDEEYKLDDLDLLASDPNESASEVDREIEDEKKQAKEELDRNHKQPALSPFMKRLLIVVGGVVGLILSYQVIQSFLFEESPSDKEMIVPVQSPVPVQKLSQVEPQSVLKPVASVSVDKTIETLQTQQNQALLSLSATTEQLTTLQATVSELSLKMSQINDALLTLNQKIEMQSQMIERVVSASHRQYKQRPQRYLSIEGRGNVHEQEVYYLQAIIPGRAWLMNASGTTLTIQEGSPLAGYGLVRKIDPQRGRVMTSSGRVIRFNQLDS